MARRRRSQRNQTTTSSVPLTAASGEEDPLQEEDIFSNSGDDESEEQGPSSSTRQRRVQTNDDDDGNDLEAQLDIVVMQSSSSTPSRTSPRKKQTTYVTMESDDSEPDVRQTRSSKPSTSTPKSAVKKQGQEQMELDERDIQSTSKAHEPVESTPAPLTSPAKPKKASQPPLLQPHEDPDKLNLPWDHPEIPYDPNENLLTIEIPPKPVDYNSNRNGYRLMVDTIIVNNFKSYCGEVILGPFHKNLNMIIGPNGSGKSNVIDALLFVFGFRSNKIRTKKLSSLIHTSAAMGKGQCTFCSVEIIMCFIRDVMGEVYDLDTGSVIRIKRIVSLDNTSKYLLNGRNASYREVEQHLKSIGVDLTHNRFLILQGEVEAIAMMKPRATTVGEEGMLEYIEDIVGSNRFVPLIKKLEHRVRKLEVQSSQQSVYAQDAERLKRELQPDVRHAQLFMNAQNEMTMLNCRLLQIERQQILDIKNQQEAEFEEQKAELVEAENTRKDKTNEIKELAAATADLETELTNCNTATEQMKQKAQDAHLHEMTRRKNLKLNVSEFVRLTAEKEELVSHLATLEQIPIDAAKKIETLLLEATELKAEEAKNTRTADENVVKYERKATNDRRRKEALDEIWAEKSRVFNEINTKIMVLESGLNDLTQAYERDSETLTRLRSEIDEMVTRNEKEKREYTELDNNINLLQNKLFRMHNELPAVVDAERSHYEQYLALHNKYNYLISKYQTNYKGNCTHQALMAAKQQGHLPGLIGRLGDLVSVDPLYDEAVSTACIQLDWYVVETADVGQACIDYLIEKSLHRCTFICLSQTIVNKAGMMRTNFPAQRVFDLIQIADQRISEVMYHCLGDLLVTETLVEAQQIDQQCKGLYRIVTLRGHTIDRSGSVAGGGHPIVGRIGHHTDANRILEQEQQNYLHTKEMSDAAALNHKTAQETRKQMEYEIESLDRTVKAQLARRNVISQSIEKHDDVLNGKVQTCSALQDKLAEWSEEIAEMRKQEPELEGWKRERVVAEEQEKKAKQDMLKIKEKMDAMFHSLVSKYRENANVYRSRFKTVEEEIAKERASIVTSEHNIGTTKAQIVTKDEELMKNRIDNNALAKAEMDDNQSIALTEDCKNNRLYSNKLGRDIKANRAKSHELEKEERDLIAKANEVSDRVSETRQSLDSYEMKLEAIRCELAKLCLRKIPQFDDIERVEMASWATFGWIRYNEHGEQEEDDDEDDEEEEEDSDEDEESRERRRQNRQKRPVATEVFDDVEELSTLTEEQIRSITPAQREQMRNNRAELQIYMNENRENTDEQIFEEYRNKCIDHSDRVAKLHRFCAELAAHRKKLNELRSMRFNEFSDALAFLSATTQALYQLITSGGNASLKFVEEGRSDPFDAGVKFIVRPARKSWKLIENLSGGEKTLASLCFVFAMHNYRATPLYVMDEIDAALDTQNVRLIAHYIQKSERTKNAQFIIISLRNQMFELADRLIGTYKVADRTSNVIVSPKEIEEANQPMMIDLLRLLKERCRTRSKETTVEGSDDLDITDDMQNVSIGGEGSIKAKPVARRHVVVAPYIEELGTDESVAPRQEVVVPAPRTVEEFDFEEDEAPVVKKRKKTVRDGDDEEGESSSTAVTEERKVDREAASDERNKPSSSSSRDVVAARIGGDSDSAAAVEALIDLSSRASTTTATTSSPRGRRRTSRRNVNN